MVRERTGHDLAHWFDVLDRFGAVEKGHTAAARHLREPTASTVGTRRASPWPASARGLRAPNQRAGGKYHVPASKVVAADTRTVLAALVQKRRRARWTGSLDRDPVGALATALGAVTSKGFIVRSDGQVRYRYTWDSTMIEIYLLPKPGGRSSLVVEHLKLPSRDALEARRKQWRTMLTAVAAHLGQGRGARGRQRPGGAVRRSTGRRPCQACSAIGWAPSLG